MPSGGNITYLTHSGNACSYHGSAVIPNVPEYVLTVTPASYNSTAFSSVPYSSYKSSIPSYLRIDDPITANASAIVSKHPDGDGWGNTVTVSNGDISAFGWNNYNKRNFGSIWYRAKNIYVDTYDFVGNVYESLVERSATTTGYLPYTRYSAIRASGMSSNSNVVINAPHLPVFATGYRISATALYLETGPYALNSSVVVAKTNYGKITGVQAHIDIDMNKCSNIWIKTNAGCTATYHWDPDLPLGSSRMIYSTSKNFTVSGAIPARTSGSSYTPFPKGISSFTWAGIDSSFKLGVCGSMFAGCTAMTSFNGFKDIRSAIAWLSSHYSGNSADHRSAFYNCTMMIGYSTYSSMAAYKTWIA